jgi:predicted nucleic-acid-binding Zn-ribbon protein
MKRSLKCPKCGGEKLWVIEKYRIPGETAEGNELSLVPHQPDGKTSRFGIGRVTPRGHFDLYVCDGCGYTELYGGGLEELVPDPARGVRLIDASVPKKGPFR